MATHKTYQPTLALYYAPHMALKILQVTPEPHNWWNLLGYCIVGCGISGEKPMFIGTHLECVQVAAMVETRGRN